MNWKSDKTKYKDLQEVFNALKRNSVQKVGKKSKWCGVSKHDEDKGSRAIVLPRESVYIDSCPIRRSILPRPKSIADEPKFKYPRQGTMLGIVEESAHRIHK